MPTTGTPTASPTVVPNILSSCIGESNLIGWYIAEQVDKSAKLWLNGIENGKSATISESDFGIYQGSNINDELHLNGRPVLYGTYETRIEFDVEVPPEHTIFSLMKYRNKGRNERILEAMAYDGVFGFSGGNSGVAIYNGQWITMDMNRFDHDWVTSTHRPDLYRGNGISFTINPLTNDVLDLNTKLAINVGNDVSDFAIAELLVANKSLNIDDITCVEGYLNAKYYAASTIGITACDSWDYGAISNSLQMRLTGIQGSSRYFYVNQYTHLSIIYSKICWQPITLRSQNPIHHSHYLLPILCLDQIHHLLED